MPAPSERPDDMRTVFLEAALWHGTLERAEALLAAHPHLRSAGIHIAAVLGDDGAVRDLLRRDPASVTATSPPYGGDALTYLCLSKYLRLDPARSDAFVRAAAALLDAGADPNTGFWTTGTHPERETALYGAAGVAHHPGVTRLLLERGADPNDDEVAYHSPEAHDNAAMRLVVETGRVTPDNLVMMLIRKHDWHDVAGARYLLERGADPNRRWRDRLPIHHALERGNALEMFAVLLDHGADAAGVAGGLSVAARAAREGRGDVLALLERRGAVIAPGGVDRLVEACARGDAEAAHAIAGGEPELVADLRAMGGTLLARFAGIGNRAGVAALLDLGVDVAAPFGAGDGYFGVPPGSLAIHVAAWRGRSEVVRLLVERGSPVDVADAAGRTPLALAVKACVDSYWAERRSPESVRVLLGAGASVTGVSWPCGYDEVDALLRSAAAPDAPPTPPC